MALLGEVDVLTNQIVCPKSPPNSIPQYVGTQIPEEEWVVEGACAYVPQVCFPRNTIPLVIGGLILRFLVDRVAS